MKKIFLILTIFLFLVSCGKTNESADINSINQIDFSYVQELQINLHSEEYLIADLSEFKVLYGKDYDKKIYPASLTKLMTLDVVLNYVDDLNETSYVSSSQVDELISLNASLAHIQTDYDYSLKDLLYALILPSGADAALAIENYFSSHNMNIIDKMNEQLNKLGCSNTNFVNTTGLHDDNHYTTLNDLLNILFDILSFEEGREIIETISYEMSDGTKLQSTLLGLVEQDSSILGGKTGFTDEAGQSVIFFYRNESHSYIMMLANAMDDRPNKESWHFIDAMEIIDKLY